jgi:glycosyltransferase involved in cell wall biosynthesis
LQIAMIAPVWIPIPPEGYGGIERMLKLLVDELVDMGIEVTLYAAGGSNTKAEQVVFFEQAPTTHMGEALYDCYHTGQAFKHIMRRDFDLVHDHAGFVGVAFASFLPIPMVHTLHGPFEPQVKNYYAGFSQDVYYVTISRFQQECFPPLNYAGVVHNAVDMEEHHPDGDKEDYLVYLSRICEAKGTHNAVRIARENGYRLIMAGKIDAGRDQEFFQREIEPYVDGENIVFLGEIPQEEKLRLLARARCFLFPIQWEEPFGLVMVEAMACGTPVVTTRWGSTPEVVEHGKTGFLADSLEDIPGYLKRVDEIDPAVCREEAVRRFSPRTMAEEYLRIYEQVLEEHRSRSKPGARHLNIL